MTINENVAKLRPKSFLENLILEANRFLSYWKRKANELTSKIEAKRISAFLLNGKFLWMEIFFMNWFVLFHLMQWNLSKKVYRSRSSSIAMRQRKLNVIDFIKWTKWLFFFSFLLFMNYVYFNDKTWIQFSECDIYIFVYISSYKYHFCLW